MAHGNDTDTAQSVRYETPTFDPRGAFSWTLRGGERARLEAQKQRNGHQDRKTLERKQLRAVRPIGHETNLARTAPYETPTFDPRGAFSWTLRAGEIAGRERQQRRRRLPNPKQLDILLAS